MLLQTTQLSPARCHQLREGGILQLMVNLLHEHTFEPHYQPEENTNIETFLFNFNRKSKLRHRLSREIRTIIENTSVDAAELQVFDLLEALRNYTETLYGFLTDVPKSKPEVVLPCYEMEKLFRMTRPESAKRYVPELIKEEPNDSETIVGYFDQFGGVYVILDLLRAQRRFVAMFQDQIIYRVINALPPHNYPQKMKDEYAVRNGFPWPEPWKSSDLPISNSVDVQIENHRLINILFHILANLREGIRVGIKGFLLNCRSFHQQLLGTLEGLNDLDYFMFLRFIHPRCCVIFELNDFSQPEAIRNSYAIDCGVIKWLTKLAMEIELSYAETRMFLFAALDSLLDSNRENVTEFLSIDGSVDILIDVLTLPEENQKSSQEYALQVLKHINFFFLKMSPNMRAERQLLALYESRDIAAILLDHIRRIPATDSEYFTWNLLEQLRKVLICSINQKQKFVQIEGAKDEIAKFHDSTDKFISKVAKLISEHI